MMIFSWEKLANLGGTRAGTRGASPIEGLASAQGGWGGGKAAQHAHGPQVNVSKCLKSPMVDPPPFRLKTSYNKGIGIEDPPILGKIPKQSLI